MDCSLPGFSVHGILQAGTLEWVAISFSILKRRNKNYVKSNLVEKEMATHSSVPAWRIPWTEKPGRLQSMGSHRVGHD